jgi:hypothetical protein
MRNSSLGVLSCGSATTIYRLTLSGCGLVGPGAVIAVRNVAVAVRRCAGDQSDVDEQALAEVHRDDRDAGVPPGGRRAGTS